MKHDVRCMVTITGLQDKANKPAEIKYLVHFVDLKKVPIRPRASASSPSSCGSAWMPFRP